MSAIPWRFEQRAERSRRVQVASHCLHLQWLLAGVRSRYGGYDPAGIAGAINRITDGIDVHRRVLLRFDWTFGTGYCKPE